MATVSGTRGRPKRIISQERVLFLRSLNFKWTDIAAIVGVSEKTLQRRIREWNVSPYSDLSDLELDRIIRSHLNEFPRVGEVMLIGYLQSLNVRVQRERIRSSVQRVAGGQHRSHSVYRRVYSVPGPKAS